MKSAMKNNDKKSYYDMKDTAGFKHVTTALRYGRLGEHIEQLKESKQLTEEEMLLNRKEISLYEKQHAKYSNKAIRIALYLVVFVTLFFWRPFKLENNVGVTNQLRKSFSTEVQSTLLHIKRRRAGRGRKYKNTANFSCQNGR
jgi:hypothetical protein